METIAFLNSLEKEFKNNSNHIIAKSQKAYMRNQFDFYGIVASKRKEIEKPLFKKYVKSFNPNWKQLAKTLWEKEQRDYQYTSQELTLQYSHEFKTEDINLFEFMIINKSWWDTVDFLSPKILGEYFKLYPETIEKQIEKWILSNNIWLQRSSLLFQLKYKENLNRKLLTHTIYSLLESKDFFIKKAIGWILREYSKTNKDWVIDFVEKTALSNLSSKEALKFIQKMD